MVYTGRIYRIENIENKNFYIGQTYKTLAQRFTNHKCEAKRGNVDGPLYRAMAVKFLKNQGRKGVKL